MQINIKHIIAENNARVVEKLAVKPIGCKNLAKA